MSDDLYTIEEVRARAERIRGLMGQYGLRQMLLSYAALLEAMDEAEKAGDQFNVHVHLLRQRAAEIRGMGGA